MKVKNKKLRIFSITIILIFLIAIIFGLQWAWKKCDEYQKNSAATLVNAEMDKLAEKYNAELSCNMIPVLLENDEYAYKVKCDKSPFAIVTLKKVKSGIMGLALYEYVSTKGNNSIDLYIPCGSDVFVNGELLDNIDIKNEFELSGTSDLISYGFSVPDWMEITVDGVYALSDITAELDGQPLSFSPYKKGYFGGVYLDGEEKSFFKDLTLSSAEKYANFLSNDIYVWTFEYDMLYNSPLRWKLENVIMEWYMDHSSTELADVTISNPVRLSDELVYATADFNYHVIFSDGTYNENPVQVTFVFGWEYWSDSWKIADACSYIEYPLLAN